MKKKRISPSKLPYLNRKTPPMNFLGLDKQFTDYDKARVIIQPLPYEGTVSYTTGTSDGPAAIIHASRYIADFDDEIKKPVRSIGIHTLRPLNPPKKYSPPEPYIRRVFEQTRKLVQDKKFIISLGGEHSLSAGIIWAYAEKFRNLSVLHMDAHGDLRDEYEGNPFSHACGLRRVAERVKTLNVGLRTLSKDQWDFAQKKKLSLIFAYEMRKAGTKRWISKVVKLLTRDVYISFDTDVLDPSEMPCTGTPEPGGISYAEVLDLFREISRKKNVVGMDIMELAPHPEWVYPDFTCARLAYKMIAFKFRQSL